MKRDRRKLPSPVCFCALIFLLIYSFSKSGFGGLTFISRFVGGLLHLVQLLFRGLGWQGRAVVQQPVDHVVILLGGQFHGFQRVILFVHSTSYLSSRRGADFLGAVWPRCSSACFWAVFICWAIGCLPSLWALAAAWRSTP